MPIAWHNLAAMGRTFYVYMLAGKSGVLYTGVTSNLVRRVWEHKQKRIPSFTQRYNLTRLVWFEYGTSARRAITREKEIKGWRRSKKLALIQATNPEWRDLSAGL